VPPPPSPPLPPPVYLPLRQGGGAPSSIPGRNFTTNSLQQ
jgi:hypothetical protein